MVAKKVLIVLRLMCPAFVVAPSLVALQGSHEELPGVQGRSLCGTMVGAPYSATNGACGGLETPNASGRMNCAFTAAGAHVSGTEEAGDHWSFELGLVAWGREASLGVVPSNAPTAVGQGVEYGRGAIREWYTNNARGLEQGFTIVSPPAGSGTLRLVLSLDGGLTPRVLPGGRDVYFTSVDGHAIYAGLRAWDALGREFDASFLLEGNRLSTLVEDEGAVYPLTVMLVIATEESKLTASDPGQYEWFGLSVSISGDTVVIGAPHDNIAGKPEAGSAYVFTRSGTGWTEEAKLHAVNGMPYDLFGYSVSISGDTALIGAINDDSAGPPAGAAYVFVRNGSSWTMEATLTARDADFFDAFGVSVALVADMALIGANIDSHSSVPNTGSAYVFTRNGTVWTEQAKLTASDPGDSDYFGSSCAIIDDNAVLIGAPFDDIGNIQAAGSAYVFSRSGAIWTEEAKLTANTGPLDRLGASVAIFGDTAVVGAPGGYSGVYPGAAYVFERNGTTWTEEKKLVASDGKGLDQFGQSVSILGDTVVIGAPYDDLLFAGADAGSAYVFVGSGATWTEAMKLSASDGRAGDLFGWSATISTETVVVGANRDQHGGLVEAGSAYVFRLAPGAPISYCVAGTSNGGCQATIGARGTASATASSGFFLTATGVEGSKDGMFFFASNGRQANPWGNGTSFQCVVPPVKRAGLLAGSGTSGACDGSFQQDLNALWCPTCPKPGHNPGAGATVQAQLWYRDPLSTSNQTTSLSDAIEFLLGP